MRRDQPREAAERDPRRYCVADSAHRVAARGEPEPNGGASRDGSGTGEGTQNAMAGQIARRRRPLPTTMSRR